LPKTERVQKKNKRNNNNNGKWHQISQYRTLLESNNELNGDDTNRVLLKKETNMQKSSLTEQQKGAHSQQEVMGKTYTPILLSPRKSNRANRSTSLDILSGIV